MPPPTDTRPEQETPQMPLEDHQQCLHGCKVEQQLEQILAIMQRIESAFPEDRHGKPDTSGHREFHERRIASADAEAAFWRELKLDLAKKGAFGIIAVLIGLILTGAAVKLGIVGVR